MAERFQCNAAHCIHSDYEIVRGSDYEAQATELRLAQAARDYNGDMLDKARARIAMLDAVNDDLARHRAGELVKLKGGLDTAKGMARYWARVVHEIENGIAPVTGRAAELKEDEP